MSTALLLSRIAAVVMFFLPGALAVSLGLFPSKWFFECGRPDFWQRRIPLRWQRPFYLLLGLALIACGVVMWLDPRGVIDR